jgi:hypothetical protein
MESQLIMNRAVIPTLIIISFLAAACKHKPDESGAPAPVKPTVCVAGKGGKVIIFSYALHGGKTISNYYTHLDTAFVKYGTTFSPGTNPTDYDTFFIGDLGDEHIHCAGLKCGDYFIYRTAWDSTAGITRYGGLGISFTDTTGDKIVNINVN